MSQRRDMGHPAGCCSELFVKGLKLLAKLELVVCEAEEEVAEVFDAHRVLSSLTHLAT